VVFGFENLGHEQGDPRTHSRQALQALSDDLVLDGGHVGGGVHHGAPPMCSVFREKNLPSLRQTPARLLIFLEQNGTGL
jgi:hypothetical protein